MILREPAVKRVSFFRIICTICLLCAHVVVSNAQGISGTVAASFSHQPLPFAGVTITFNDSIAFEVMTDEHGVFEFQTDRAGRVTITISVSGYTNLLVKDIILDGYSTIRLDQLLEKDVYDLAGVTVVAGQTQAVSYIRTITSDDILLVAGNFEDPVRIAHSQPGIVLLNDQANQLSARGKSPVFNSWLLEGLDIVNPNHTNNAGTFSDLPTQYGGGVNMFSAQTLGATDVYMGINPLSINNVSGAAIDMHLHETVKPEWRAKAGLLGFELGGGVDLGKQRILDFNFRYSFTGLLTAMGADFGGEQINYYDGVLSYRQHQDAYTLKAFAWAGHSINTFNKADNAADIEEYKDYFDIRYGNDILGAGATYDLSLNPKLRLKSGAAFSTNNSAYSKLGSFETYTDSLDQEDRINIFSAFLELAIRHSDRIESTVGINYKNRSYGRDDYLDYPYLPFTEESLLRPYISTTIWVAPKWQMDLGADLSYSTTLISWDPGYRASLNWHYDSRGSLFAGVRHGIGDAIQPMIFDEVIASHMRNQVYEAGWSFSAGHHSLLVDVYAHKQTNLTRQDLADGFVHDADYPYTINTSGNAAGSLNAKGMYTGIEGQWNYSSGGWRFNINQTLYKSERDRKDESLAPGRYNGQYATHVTLAKELIKEKKGKSRIWNFSLRGMLHGGLWEQQIDPAASAQHYTTLYTLPGTFDQRLDDYKRVDLSIVRTVGFAKIRWRYALDIQNVFGFSNTAWHYYDPYLKSVAAQEQLGLIPVLSVQASW